MLVWLSVESEKICVWSSWCHCHPIVSCFVKIQNGSAFLISADPNCRGKEAVKWILLLLILVLLARIVTLHRAKVAYSRRTFPPTICWSVCLSVCPVHCGKTADRIWMRFGMVGRMGPGMRQVVGFGDWSMVGGNFGGECGVPHL